MQDSRKSCQNLLSIKIPKKNADRIAGVISGSVPEGNRGENSKKVHGQECIFF